MQPWGMRLAVRSEAGVIVRCPRCQTAYRMDAGRVPATGLRVRCPRCGHVFSLHAVPEPPPAAPVRRAAAPREVKPAPGLGGFERDLREPPRPRPAPPAPGQKAAPAAPAGARPLAAAWHAQPERTLDLEPPPPKSAPPRLETPPFNPLTAGEPVPVTATTTVPVPAAEREDPVHARARRLARVLVSDILVYNQAVRDRARREGNLAAALGAEIGKAWELYKSKVGPEVASSTPYFKDALNEILSEGEKIF